LEGWVPGESEFDAGSAAAPPLSKARAAMDTAQRTTSCPTRRRLVALFGTPRAFVACVATASPSPTHRRQHDTVAPSHQLRRRTNHRAFEDASARYSYVNVTYRRHFSIYRLARREKRRHRSFFYRLAPQPFL
jgi:hypothetical protein